MDGRPVSQGVNPLRRALAQVTLFLPVLLLSALALGSFFLYQTSKGVDGTVPAVQGSGGPDYYVERFALRQYDARGLLQSEVYGQKAVHYPATSQLEITDVRINRTTQEGQLLTASADKALSSDDRTDIQLLGNAQVRMTARPNAPLQEPVEFFSEQLRVLSTQKVVFTDSPSTVRQGRNTFSSATMHYDHAAQVFSLRGNVLVTLVPRTP